MQIFVLAHSLKRTCIQMGLSLFGLPRLIRENGFEGLEISDRQLAGFDENSLQRLAQESISNQCGLIIDINVDFTTPDSRLLEQDIDHAKKMMVIASELKATRVRICLGGQALTVQKFFRRRRAVAASIITSACQAQLSKNKSGRVGMEKMVMLLGHYFRRSTSSHVSGLENKMRRAIDSMRKIGLTAAERGIQIGIENHWGISGDPKNIMRIIKEVDSSNLGTCPDMGNFPRGIDPDAALSLLAPRAIILHAKSYRFRQDGEETSIDYKKCLSSFRESGFDGPITVEFEGMGGDLEGCLFTKELILRHWAT